MIASELRSSFRSIRLTDRFLSQLFSEAAPHRVEGGIAERTAGGIAGGRLPAEDGPEKIWPSKSVQSGREGCPARNPCLVCAIFTDASHLSGRGAMSGCYGARAESGRA